MDSQPDRAAFKPTLKYAIGMLIFAVLFAALMWLEHRWRISRGDYPGPYLKHTWYWTARTWIAFGVLAASAIWGLVRLRR